jgi:hypothetical protein
MTAYGSYSYSPFLNSSFIHYPEVKYNIIMKKTVMTGMVIGSFAGSYIPLMWGDSMLSMSPLFFGALGGFIGIWAGYQIGKNWT